MPSTGSGSSSGSNSPSKPTLGRLENVCELDFDKLWFTIPTRGQEKLQILSGISGACRAGRLTACLGPSGAGKSTLLKILACNVSGGTLSGAINMNGRPLNTKELRRQSTIVWQRDLLLSTATVRETLMTSAQLRLPQSMPRHEKQARVEQIINELELQRVANTIIGDERDGAMTGISGGERRRVSVGIGLVTDPKAIFLDEPTTGLDSENALKLMELLAKLSKKGRTVVCTIHQPSGDIMKLFDDLLLIAQGRLLFYGEWASAGCVFDKLGYPCPSHRSLAEHLLAVCRDERAVHHSADLWAGLCSSLASRGSKSLQQTGFEMHPKAGLPDIPGDTDVEAGSIASTSASEDEQLSTRTSRAHQVRILGQRFLLSWWRSPINLLVQLAQYIFFAVMIGLSYWQISDQTTAGTFDRTACLWFSMSVVTLQPSANAVSIFNQERDVLRRELSNGMYKLSSFYISKSLTSLPFQSAFVFVYSVIIYFCAGLRKDAGAFLAFFALMLLQALISETIGMGAGAVHRNSSVGLIVSGALLLMLMLNTGFIQTRTPVYFRWLKQASFVTHAYNALVQNEFRGLSLYQPGGIAVPADSLLPSNLHSGLSLGQDFAVVCCVLLGLRIIVFFELVWQKRCHRL